MLPGGGGLELDPDTAHRAEAIVVNGLAFGAPFTPGLTQAGRQGTLATATRTRSRRRGVGLLFGVARFRSTAQLWVFEQEPSMVAVSHSGARRRTSASSPHAASG